MSIWQEAGDWRRTHSGELFWAVLMFLVATLSFGAGYLYSQNTNNSPIVVEKCSETSNL